MGFRYIEIKGAEYYPGLVKAYALYSDMKRIGNFDTGNEKINKLYHNIIWGQKSNFIDIPTDCPQRDERQGYTGDAQIFGLTASLNFNTSKFFEKYLTDLRLLQTSFGAVDSTIPNEEFADDNRKATVGWGNAATILPDMLYEQYGDLQQLKISYTSMKKWCDYELENAARNRKKLWIGFHLGDWLTYKKSVGYIILKNKYVTNAYIYHDCVIMEKTARLLGYEMDAIYYAKKGEEIKKAYIKHFIKKMEL